MPERESEPTRSIASGGEETSATVDSTAVVCTAVELVELVSSGLSVLVVVAEGAVDEVDAGDGGSVVDEDAADSGSMGGSRRSASREAVVEEGSSSGTGADGPTVDAVGAGCAAGREASPSRSSETRSIEFQAATRPEASKAAKPASTTAPARAAARTHQRSGRRSFRSRELRNPICPPSAFWPSDRRRAPRRRTRAGRGPVRNCGTVDSAMGERSHIYRVPAVTPGPNIASTVSACVCRPREAGTT